jgi:hypothetical protein
MKIRILMILIIPLHKRNIDIVVILKLYRLPMNDNRSEAKILQSEHENDNVGLIFFYPWFHVSEGRFSRASSALQCLSWYHIYHAILLLRLHKIGSSNDSIYSSSHFCTQLRFHFCVFGNLGYIHLSKIQLVSSVTEENTFFCWVARASVSCKAKLPLYLLEQILCA